MRSVSDSSSSEASRHSMELKQVSDQTEMSIVIMLLLLTNHQGVFIIQWLTLFARLSNNCVILQFEKILTTSLFFFIMQRDLKIRELEQNVEKLGDQYTRKCEESDR